MIQGIQAFLVRRAVFTTRVELNKLLDDAPQQVEKFHEAALAFLYRAVEFAMYESSSIEELPQEEPPLTRQADGMECGKHLRTTFLLFAWTSTLVIFEHSES